jgi:hypothetical protein
MDFAILGLLRARLAEARLRPTIRVQAGLAFDI